MPSAYKTLGQAKPAAATLTDLYVVPALTQAVASRLFACNQSATPTSIRVAIAPLGAADTPAHYIAYDLPIQANETIDMSLGAGLAATSKVRVYCTLATVSFTLNGVELT